MCPALGLSRDEARHNLPLFDGLRQHHIARKAAGEDLTWPEAEELEEAEIAAGIERAFESH